MNKFDLQGINVFLIGMMGVGKTTVGQLIARELDYRFFDTDVLIERVAGKTINEIFATEGEKSFRQLETKVLQELSPYGKSAIATGGGIVLERKNWSYLHLGLIIWLDASVELLCQRLAEDNTRPLLQERDPAAKLQSLLEQRRPLYQQADIQLAIEPQETPAEIAQRAIEMIPTVLKTKNKQQITNNQ